MEHSTKQMFAVVLLIVLYCLVSCRNWNGLGITTSKDAAEGEAIWRTFREVYYEGDSNNEESILSCYTVGGSYHRITVYDVTSAKEQDRVLSILTDIKEEQDTMPMVVSFYEKLIRITTQHEGGVTVTKYEAEGLLRKETIE